jgi:hypothetical protein
MTGFLRLRFESRLDCIALRTRISMDELSKPDSRATGATMTSNNEFARVLVEPPDALRPEDGDAEAQAVGREAHRRAAGGVSLILRDATPSRFALRRAPQDEVHFFFTSSS